MLFLPIDPHIWSKCRPFRLTTEEPRGAKTAWIASPHAQHRVSSCDVFQPGDADEWLASDVKGQNIFAVRVKGDSMEPEFTDGDIIVLDPHRKPNSGDYVIVRNDEGEATLKQLRVYGKTRVLHPLNPKYPDIELSEKHQYEIAGKVVEKKKRY